MAPSAVQLFLWAILGDLLMIVGVCLDMYVECIVHWQRQRDDRQRQRDGQLPREYGTSSSSVAETEDSVEEEEAEEDTSSSVEENTEEAEEKEEEAAAEHQYILRVPGMAPVIISLERLPYGATRKEDKPEGPQLHSEEDEDAPLVKHSHDDDTPDCSSGSGSTTADANGYFLSS